MAVFTYPTNGQDTPDFGKNDVYSLALHYARQIISDSQVTYKYAAFDKTPVEFGAIIQAVRTKLSQSTSPDPNATTIPAPNYTQFDERFFADWKAKMYNTVVRTTDVKEIVMGSPEFETLVATIIANLDLSEISEANMQYKSMFAQFGTSEDRTLINVKNDGTVSGFLSNSYTKLDEPTDEQIFTLIRDIVKDFQFQNSSYSNGFECEVRPEDIRIIAPYKWLNKTGVEFLAKLFNLEKADMMAQIIETDGCTDNNGSYAVIITDVNTIGRVTKSKEQYSTFVPAQRGMGYYNFIDEMYYYAPAYKAHAILFNKHDYIECRFNVISGGPSPERVNITENGIAVPYTRYTLDQYSVVQSVLLKRGSLISAPDASVSVWIQLDETTQVGLSSGEVWNLTSPILISVYD